MAILTVDDVRFEIFTSTLDDLDIQNIINRAYSKVLRATGVSDDSSPDIQTAIEHTALELVKRRMKDTGELAPSFETPGSKQQNSADKDIEFHHNEAKKIIDTYREVRNSAYSSPSCYSSFDCGGR